MGLHRNLVLGIGIYATVATAAVTPVYTELAPKFILNKSRATVREIAKPTMANLDFTAYDKNPVRLDFKAQKPKMPAAKVTFADLGYDGALSDVVDSVGKTPLTEAELSNPLAWKPLSERLWKAIKNPFFAEVTGKIEGKKWADPAIPKPYQEIAVAYVHKTTAGVELWVRIDFPAWSKFLAPRGADENKDGFCEVYGKLSLDKLDKEVWAKALAYIEQDYCVKVLSKDEITDWVTILASYWYPAFNTDIIDMTNETAWPIKDTDKDVAKALKGFSVKNPTAVVKGNPFGKLMYNVYVVKEQDGAVAPVVHEQAAAAPVAAIIDKRADTAVSANMKANYTRLAAEIKPFITYEAWAKQNAAGLGNLKTFLGTIPAEQMGFEGKDNWVFFRKSCDYILGGDLNAQAKDKNPIPSLVELKKFLASKGVNLLFVPVPNKEEVYYDKLPCTTIPDAAAVYNPYSRKFIKDAQDAGIEVIDLLPLFLAAKAKDKDSKEKVYQLHDTHWTDRGLEIAATAIADRVKQYGWYSSITPAKYSIVDTTFDRQGDIVDKLPDALKSKYAPVNLKGAMVRAADGKPYKGAATDPIILMGDSFTGVFESVDCKSAGVGAHIAANSGVGVDIITSWGGGPGVRNKMLRARSTALGQKRLVIYMMVARDLYNYSQSWEPLKPE